MSNLPICSICNQEATDFWQAAGGPVVCDHYVRLLGTVTMTIAAPLIAAGMPAVDRRISHRLDPGLRVASGTRHPKPGTGDLSAHVHLEKIPGPPRREKTIGPGIWPLK